MYLVECKPDTILVKPLTSMSMKNIHHAGNKSELLKKLTERTNSIGIIDEDPWSVQPPHLKKFEEKQDLANYKLKILHHTSKNNVLIVLRPRLEEWILGAAKEANVDLKTYNLPNEAVKLHEQINIQINNFQKLLEDIKDKSNRIKSLKEHLVEAKKRVREQ